MKFELDVCATDKSSMVHEDKKLDEVEKLGPIVLHEVQDKAVPVVTLIPHILYF